LTKPEKNDRHATARDYARHVFACLALLLIVPCIATNASAERGYAVAYEAILEPATGQARVTLTLEQATQLLRSVSFRMPADRYLNIESDSPVARDGNRVTWRPGHTGGVLSYDYIVDNQRSNGAPDAKITPSWALLKLDHLFPSANSTAAVGAYSTTRVTLKGPTGWSIETPYGASYGESFFVDDPNRRFDQPRGWMLAGNLAVRRDAIGEQQLSVASPRGLGLHANDILAFLRWTLPEMNTLLPGAPRRLLVVSGSDDMWRGGLSGRDSLYLHPGRPLVSGNRTSTLLHELFHVFSGLRAKNGDGADWIVEGLAEYYSIALLQRSGGISDHRYRKGLAQLAEWSAGKSCDATDDSSGARTAAAALVMHSLDRELRSQSNGRYSLDTLVQTLVANSPTVTNSGFKTLAGELAGQPAVALIDCPG
jgi:hypothetical protein